MKSGTRAAVLVTIIVVAILIAIVSIGVFISLNMPKGNQDSEPTNSPSSQSQDEPAPNQGEQSEDGSSTELPPEYHAVKAVESTLEGSEVPLGVAHPDFLDVTCELLYVDGLNVTETATVLEHDLIVTHGVFEPNFNVYMEYVAMTDVEWCQGIRGY